MCGETGSKSEDLWDRLMSIKRGAAPFNRPTNISVAPDGEVNGENHQIETQKKLVVFV